MRISFISVIVFCSISLIAANTLAQNNNSTNFDPVSVYGSLPEISQMVISPSGNRIAFRQVTQDVDMMTVFDLKQRKLVRRVDVSNVQPDSSFFIDDDLIVFNVSSAGRIISGYSGTYDISAALSYNIKTDEMFQLLTAGYGIHSGQTALGNVLGITPDKKHVLIPAYQSQDRRKQEFRNLYRVDLLKKRKPKVHAYGSHDVIDFFVDDKGKVLARERYNNKTDLHRIEAYHDGDWVNIHNEETPILTKAFSGVSSDRKHLVFRSYASNSNRIAYFKMALKDGKIEGPIFEHPDKDVEGIITDANRTVYGVRYSGFTPTYEFFDKELDTKIRNITSSIPDASVTIQDFTPDWKQIVFYIEGDLQAGDFVLYNEGKMSQLAKSRKKIGFENYHDVQTYSFKARDDMTIPSLLTLPNNREPKNLPAIMLPHGGPESYDRLGFDWLAQYFASKGYAVIQPQFRGSRGFGYRHLAAGRGEWGRKMQDDLTDAKRDLAQKGIIDPERVCIVGASYGGYAALAGIAFTPDEYKCAVSINGVSDIPRMLRRERREYGSKHWVVSYWDNVIKGGGFKADSLKDISPINSVKNVKYPVLLVHGEIDKVVDIEQSELMHKALLKAGKDVDFVELEDTNHYLDKSTGRMSAMRAIDKFIDKHMPAKSP